MHMNFKHQFFLIISFLFLFSSCAVTKKSKTPSLQLKLLDEYVIPSSTFYEGEEIGGLSAVEYAEGQLYLLDDRSSKPIIYTANLHVENQKIIEVDFINSMNLKKTDTAFQQMALDLEALSYADGNFWLASEGGISYKKNPSIFQVNKEGKLVNQMKLPAYFEIGGVNQPRNNGVFESLSFDFKDSNLLWSATELPLEEDGKPPFLWNRFSPVRFSQFQTESLEIQQEYAYPLDRVVKWPLLPFVINGVTEILAYQNNRFLVIERAFSAGRGKRSNRVKLFLADFSEAESTLNQPVLDKSFQLAEKELILDFKDIRKQLPSKIIDNIEGMCFGPQLKNGNRTLLFISDNNFNSFGEQITQLIWMEVLED